MLDRSTTLALLLLASGLACSGEAPEPVDFASHEEQVFSQQGEDGVIAKLFELIEPSHRFVVEFGAGDGILDSNVRNLVVNEGWASLQIEGDKKLAKKLARNYADYPTTKAVYAWVYPGNVELLFEENDVPKDFDLLIIDIDSNDYYVWRSIRDFRPKVVQIEYNASFAPPQKMVVDFHPSNFWDGTDYFGASIQSLYELGKRKGYELVYASKDGVNLYFVDAPYFERFGIRDNSPEALYQPPSYGKAGTGRAPNGLGHPKSGPMHKTLPVDAFDIKKRFRFDR